MCSDICPRTLSVPKRELAASSRKTVSFEKQVMSKDNEISEHIFASNGGYCVYYPSKIGKYLLIYHDG